MNQELIDKAREGVRMLQKQGASQSEIDSYLSSGGLTMQTLGRDEPSIGMAKPGPVTPINMDREANISSNILAGMTSSTAGKVGAAERWYDNVATDREGNVMVKNRWGWIPLNRPGMSPGDVGEVLGQGIWAVPSMWARRPSRVAGGEAVSEGARQLAGHIAAQGKDDPSVQQRLMQVGGAGLLGGATQKASDLLFSGVDYLRPRNFLARDMMDNPAVVSGREVEKATGVDFLPGQLSGNRSLLTLEGLARRHPVSAGMFQRVEEGRMKRMLGYLDTALDRWSARPAGDRSVSSVALGQRVRTAYDNVTNDLHKFRSNVARQDFAALDGVTGRQAIFDMSSTLQALDEVIETLPTGGAGSGTKGLIEELKDIRADLRTPRTGHEMNNLLGQYGKIARGKAKLYEKADHSQSAMIGKRVFGALQDDLKLTAQNMNELGKAEVAHALSKARTNYAQNSVRLNEIAETSLARMLGSDVPLSPEQLAERIVKMDSTHLGAAYRIANEFDPAIGQDIKVRIVEEAMTKGHRLHPDAPPPQFGGEDIFSAADFLRDIRKPGGIWGVLDRGEKFELQVAVKGLERLSTKLGEGSPTAPLLLAAQMAKDIFTGQMLNPAQMARAAAGLFVPYKLAKLLTSRGGRQDLTSATMRSTGQPVQRTAAALARVLERLAATPEPQDHIAPDPDLEAAQEYQEAN